MKTISLVVTLALMVAASSSLADEKPAEKAKEKKPAKPAKTTQRQVVQHDYRSVVTGSHLKQNLRHSGMITDGANNVVVLDSEYIRNSGAADVKQLLIRRGVH